jgi:hypothetical protein
MIIYVPSSAAKELSEALWELSRPAYLQNSGDTTQMFSWIDDVHGNRWIEVYDDFSIIIHPSAELGKIADILQPWIDDGHLPSTTNAELAALIEANRGQRLVIYSAFPQLFKDMSKTYEEMVAAGFLPAGF